MVIATADKESSVSITVKPGNRPAPHCSAQGRIALAYATAQQRDRLLRGNLRAMTPHSLTGARKVRARLERIRARLWEEAPDEAMLGINVVAAPVLRDGDELVGIVAIVGSILDVKSPPDRRQLALVQGAAAALSAMLEGGAYRERSIGVPKELRSAGRGRGA